MKLAYVVFALSLCPTFIHGFKLDRVILATDNHPNYIQFWPVVAQAWSEIVGITPTLALIADDSVKIDETLGDVIRFAPIDGVKTSLHAQTIRLLLPTMFPDEICILSDIDIIPLSKEYFVDSVKNFADDTFIVYQNLEYDPRGKRWPMCYCAAKGSTFREIFQTYSMKKIRELIIEWSTFNLNWDTDELMLFKYVSSWKKYKTHCILLNHKAYPHRIDRFKPETFKLELVPTGHYWDMHWLRPFNDHKQDILKVLELLPTPLKFEERTAVCA